MSKVIEIKNEMEGVGEVKTRNLFDTKGLVYFSCLLLLCS